MDTRRRTRRRRTRRRLVLDTIIRGGTLLAGLFAVYALLFSYVCEQRGYAAIGGEVVALFLPFLLTGWKICGRRRKQKWKRQEEARK